MAKQENTPQPLPAPVPVAPLEEEVVDGQSVTFTWEPVDGAQGYRLEVAHDSEFDDLAYEQDVDGTTHTATDVFVTDGETYFWRVMARNAAGLGSGERVESFISATAGKAAEHMSRPEEKYGPYPNLIGAAGLEAAAEISQSPELWAEEHELGVEHEGVESGQIMGLTLALIVAVGMIIFILFQWVDIVHRETRDLSIGISGYPELRETEIEAMRQLGEYGILDEEAGVYRIPIDRAMDLMVNEEYAQPRTEAYSPEMPQGPLGR